MDWISSAFMIASAAGITLWVAGAIYYDTCGATGWGGLLAASWAGGVLLLLVVWQPLWQPFSVLVAVAALFLAGWLCQKPSHTRDWDASVAVLPRAARDGDAVTIENIRNFDYRSLVDFTARYDARTYHLSNLNSLDLIFFYWGSPWMSHP